MNIQSISKKSKLSFAMLLLFLATTNIASAQTFMHPRWKAKNADHTRIILVKITEESTIVRLQINAALSSICISSKSYITDSKGGDLLYIRKAYKIPPEKGINLFEQSDKQTELPFNKLITEDKPGITFLDLYFPRLKNDVSSFHFRSGDNGNYWHFFDIKLNRNIGVDNSIKSGSKGKEGNCLYIDNPGYVAKSGGFHITKVELCDTATILHFKLYLGMGAWFSVPSMSCIRDSKGGDYLFVTSAEGTNINEKYTAGNSDVEVFYRLFFPPIDKSVKKIDFKELNEGGNWSVYELDTDFED